MPLAVVNVADSADRGDNSPGALVLTVAAVTITQSWGTQPASAEIVCVAPVVAAGSIADAVSPVAPYTYVELVTPGYTFYGVCVDYRADDTSGGKTATLSFQDLRMYLRWDHVWALFNQPVDEQVVDGLGIPRRVRRWKHLLPGNYDSDSYTVTNAPLTAYQVLNQLFSAPTLGSPWVNNYHPDVLTTPVLNLDFRNGVQLDQALGAIAEKLGLQFTLAGLPGTPYRLLWRRKGTLLAGETFPTDVFGRYVFPPGTVGAVQGISATENPTRVRVVCGEDRIQVLNLEMVPDWPAVWNPYWDFLRWLDHVRDVFTAPIAGDTHGSKRAARAFHIANTITVAQYAASHPSRAGFADSGRFAGLARGNMPVALYLREVVFRCWRLPATVLGKPARSWTLLDQALCQVEHNDSGVMTPDLTLPSEGSGYAIANGVGINWAMFQVVDPNRFDVGEWVSRNAQWTSHEFRLGDAGLNGVPFIQFSEPLQDTDDLLLEVNGRAVLNAAYLPAPPSVRASLTLRGAKYSAWFGTGSRDGSYDASGLFREIVRDAGGGTYGEIGFADGETVHEKAAALASPLLARQWTIYSGVCSRAISWGATGLVMNGMYDRITVEVNSGGTTERVDFTKERRWNTFIPEREYDRMQRTTSLFPGQEQLRLETQTSIALMLAAPRSPGFQRAASEITHWSVGIPSAPVRVTIQGGVGTMPAGTPLWSATSADRPVMPSVSGESHPVFVGVTTRDGEPATGGVPVLNAMVMRARVTGGDSGVAVHDRLGRSDGNTFLEASESGSMRALDAVPAGTVRLIEVERVGGGGGSDGFLWA